MALDSTQTKTPHLAFTTVTNIKSLIPVTLSLKAPNYKKWRRFFTLVATRFNLHGYLDGTTVSTGPEDLEWSQLDSLLQTWILNTISDDVSDLLISSFTTSHALWEAIDNLFRDNKKTRAVLPNLGYHIGLAENTSSWHWNPRWSDLAGLALGGEAVNVFMLVIAFLVSESLASLYVYHHCTYQKQNTEAFNNGFQLSICTRNLIANTELGDLIYANNSTSKQNKTQFRKILQRKYSPPLVMSIAISLFFQQMTGINVIAFYAPILFRIIGFKESASLLSAVMTGVVELGSTFVQDSNVCDPMAVN